MPHGHQGFYKIRAGHEDLLLITSRLPMNRLAGALTKLAGMLALMVASFAMGLALEESRNHSKVLESPDHSRFAVVTMDDDGPRITILFLRVYERRTVFDENSVTEDVLVFATDTRASNRMKWNLEWDGNSAIVLHSSDIGDRRWEMDEHGDWHPTADVDTEQE